jgi:ATP-binding cassette, subfamily B, bacterial
MGFTEDEPMKISLKHHQELYITYLKQQWLRVLSLAILLFGSIGLQLVNPQILRYFIDAAREGTTTQKLTAAALLFIGVALLQQIASVLSTYFSEQIAWTATNSLRGDLARHCLRLDMSFHNARTPGEMIERIDGDVGALGNFFSRFIIQVFGNILLLIGILIILFLENWWVGLVFSVFTIFTLMLLNSLRDQAVPHWAASRQASADVFGFLEERLSGTEDIRSNGGKAYVLRRFYQLMRTWMKHDLKAAFIVNIMANSTWVLLAVGNAIALVLGGYLFREGIITIGTVYLIFHYTNMLMRPIELIIYQIQDLQKASASVGRLKELMDIESRVHDGSGVRLPPGPLSVTFQEVSFGYVPDETVIKNLSLHLQPGRVLGLLGRTGSGKTTLARLLFRLYDPGSGYIRLGNADIRDMVLADLRQRVGMVTQDVQLFQATVRDNLTFFDQGLHDKKIVEMLHELGLSDWYESLKDGLDTELSSNGEGISAGEAQLLAFIRVFLGNPGVVILDEASSRLDVATEQLIEKAIDGLLFDRTAIIIAHRLATLHRADEILILEDGRIREYGARKALAADPNSYFYSLLKTGLEEVLA